MLRDLKPTDNVGGFDVRPGNFLLNGATTVSGGVNFTIHSVYAVECTLLLFRPYAKFPYARLRFPDSYKIGNTYSMLVFGLDEIDFEYAYSFDGPYEPEKGIIFDKKKYILDPYAKAVIGQSGWGKKQEHEGVYKARVVNSDYDWGNCTQPKLPFEELIIYELHVRGFTQDGSSGVKNKGTFAGIREKIPYLKELGINAVEMMPIFEFDEMGSYRNYEGRQLYDYWGYNTVCFLLRTQAMRATTSIITKAESLNSLFVSFTNTELKLSLMLCSTTRQRAMKWDRISRSRALTTTFTICSLRTESITISAVAAMFSTAISRLCSSLYLTVCVIG